MSIFNRNHAKKVAHAVQAETTREQMRRLTRAISERRPIEPAQSLPSSRDLETELSGEAPENLFFRDRKPGGRL